MSVCSSLMAPSNSPCLDNTTCISFLMSALDAHRRFLASSLSSLRPSVSSSLQEHLDACNPSHLSSLTSCRDILCVLVSAFTSLHQLNDSLSQIQNLDFEKVNKVTAIGMMFFFPSSFFFLSFLFDSLCTVVL